MLRKYVNQFLKPSDSILLEQQDKSSPLSATCYVTFEPTTWQSYHDHRLSDIISLYAYNLKPQLHWAHAFTPGTRSLFSRCTGKYTITHQL